MAGWSNRGSNTTSCSCGPHRVLVSPHDADRHVWLVDDGAHAIYKFTRDGKQLVMTVGTPRMPGNDETHFARPTDVAFLPDGTFFVSDGYTNTRVVKFDRNGKYITSWGMRGTPPNETRPYYMNTVHAIVIDKQRRLYVSDRANHRIQIFDENGKFLDAWPNVPLPYSLLMTDDQFLWSASGDTQKFTKYDLNGRLLAAWGTFGALPGDSGVCTSSTWIVKGASTRLTCTWGGRRSFDHGPVPTGTGSLARRRKSVCRPRVDVERARIRACPPSLLVRRPEAT